MKRKGSSPFPLRITLFLLVVGLWFAAHTLTGTNFWKPSTQRHSSLRNGGHSEPPMTAVSESTAVTAPEAPRPTMGSRDGQVKLEAAPLLLHEKELHRMVARMFVVGKPHAGGKWNQEWEATVAKGVGGVIIARDNYHTPRKLWELTVALKTHSNNMLAIMVDQEGGWRGKYKHGQAFVDGFTSLPKMGTIGSMHKNDTAVQQQISQEVAAAKFRELRAVNVDVNFDPVMDVNSNPRNPVIGDRAISGDPDRVALLGSTMISAGQAQSVGAVAKHFPGHGDTTTDSHMELPQVTKTLEQLWQVELKPFAAAVRANVSGIMTAHILYPKVDAGRPATMSPIFIHQILRSELKYDGVVFSDSLDMKAVMNSQMSIHDVVVQAVNAGVDMLVTSNKRTDNFEDRAIVALMDAVKAGLVSEARIREANARIDRLFAIYVRPPTAEFSLSPDPKEKHRHWFKQSS